MQAPSVVTMSNGPSSVGIYSQAVALGELLFCGGQLPAIGVPARLMNFSAGIRAIVTVPI